MTLTYVAKRVIKNFTKIKRMSQALRINVAYR